MEKVVLKLVDRSIILGNVINKTDNIIEIDSPMALTSVPNPQTGSMDIGIVPMDMVFEHVKEGKNNVILKKEHIMWEKDMEDFPDYMTFYIQQTSGIVTPDALQ